MNKFFVIILLLLSIHQNIFAQKMVLVKGYVTSTHDYCGGAAPSPEILKDLNTENPVSKKVLFIKIGTQNNPKSPVYKKIITDEQGQFTVQLQVGQSYFFIEEWKVRPFSPPSNSTEITWDIQCLRERYLKPDFVLKVKKAKNDIVKINFHIPCSYAPYCGTYSGPLPP
jgi:hypothetical protein